MADTVYNIAKRQLTTGDLAFDTADVRALLLAVADTGYDDPDLNTVAALLAVGTTAEPAAGERVAVGTITFSDETTSDANNRAEVQTPTVSFAADTGESAVAIVFYTHVGADSSNTLISVHDFASVALDGGLDVDPTSDTWRLA